MPPLPRIPGRPSLLRASLAVLAALLWMGCGGGYAERVDKLRNHIDHGNVPGAIAAADDLIRRAEKGEKPERNDLPLLLLERGALLQAEGRHTDAVADFGHADQLLEVLDLTPDNVGNVAKYLYSDDTGLYRAPVYEKLMVNVCALASYLAAGDLRGARVEARRIQVLLDFWESSGRPGHPILGAAGYMGGLAMEVGGDTDRALRMYVDAWKYGNFADLAERIVRLAPRGGSVGRRPEVAQAREALGLRDGQELPPPPEREVIAIVFSGRAPYRVAERLPVGLVYAWMVQDAAYAMSPQDQAAYDRLVVEGALTWVNYPVLVVQQPRFDHFRIRTTEGEVDASPVADIESFAIGQWERDQPGIAFAAITRAIVRIIARESTQAIGEGVGLDDALFPGASWLLGLGVQGTMQAFDTPDTRVWTTMPGFLHVARFELGEGPQAVVLTAHGAGGTQSERHELEMPARGRRFIAVRFF